MPLISSLILQSNNTQMTIEFRRRMATYLALAMIPLSGFATDIYLPSLPQMGVDLHVSSLEVQLTLSIFLISYGVSQLFIGALLDSFGRYKPGLVALVLFAVASAVIATTNSIEVIYAMRAMQGLTVATIVVAKRAYFVDVYQGDELKSYLPCAIPFVDNSNHLDGSRVRSNTTWACTV